MMKAIALLIAVGLVAVAARPDMVRYLRGPEVKQCDPTPDPNPFEPSTVNLTLSPIIVIAHGSSHQGGVITGGSEATIDVGIIIITLQLTFNVQVPTLDVEAAGVMATGFLDTRPLQSIPVGNFSAVGDDGTAEIRGLVVRGNAALFINLVGNRVNIRTLDVIELKFDNICLNLGSGFTIGGSTPDWTDLCANLKSKFDQEWANTAIRTEAIEKIRVTGNDFVSTYTLEELIELIGGIGDGC